MTAEEASIIVKYFLGITGEFVLEPALPIVPIDDNDALYNYLHPTFVKISDRTFGGYEIKTGKVIDDTIDFDKVATVKHNIKKGSTNIVGIHTNFTSLQHSEDVKDTVLPELYKRYMPTEKESQTFGFKDLYISRNLRIAEVGFNVFWKKFTTEKGDPITLNLMGDYLLDYYPYIEKRWWVKAEAEAAAEA